MAQWRRPIAKRRTENRGFGPHLRLHQIGDVTGERRQSRWLRDSEEGSTSGGRLVRRKKGEQAAKLLSFCSGSEIRRGKTGGDSSSGGGCSTSSFDSKQGAQREGLDVFLIAGKSPLLVEVWVDSIDR